MDIEPKIKLWNSLSRQKENFTPVKPGRASVYLCGPTVYDRATIGNFRTYIFGDILRRVLTYNGYQVTYVQNITDVGHLVGDGDLGEDKMERGAKVAGKSALETANFFIKLFSEDSQKLNIIPPTVACRATEHIKEQLEMILELERRGFTYKTSDGIYFDTGRQKDYGKLAGLDIAGLKEGARVKINPEKRNATDFALWKFSPAGGKRQMEWPSPWGVGFPGWHIECSAMSIKYLGEPFDIHGGGADLIPVHHTNEIAQNEAVYGHQTVNYWLHGGFVQVDGSRMGKSLGNAYTVADIAERGFDPLSFRYLTLLTHYRQPLNFTWEGLAAAEISYKKLIRLTAGNLKDGGQVDEDWNNKFLTAINNDLNMPEAVAIVWEMMKSPLPPADKRATIEKFDEVLGLGIKNGAKKMKEGAKKIPLEILELLQERNLARKNKEWRRADEIRKKIEQSGYRLEDREKETTISAG